MAEDDTEPERDEKDEDEDEEFVPEEAHDECLEEDEWLDLQLEILDEIEDAGGDRYSAG